MIHEFTKDQNNAYNEILNFCNNSEKKILLLNGAAGTGKTFLISRIVEKLNTDTKYKISVCTPTNKALKVIRNQITIPTNKNLIFKTIHALHGLREYIDGYGKVTFIRDQHATPQIDSTHILFIDEASMLDDLLFNLTVEYVDEIKIIFIGDSAQIPPINKEESIVFVDEMKQLHNIHQIDLNEIVRQKANNPIINYSYNIRNNLFEKNIRENVLLNSKYNIDQFSSKHELELFLQLIQKLFTSSDFKVNQDYAKIIAWTNDMVTFFNEIVRQYIFGENIPYLMKNEKIIADKPVVFNDRIIIYTNDELNVLDYSIKDTHLLGRPIRFYKALVQNELNQEYAINIVHENSFKTYANLVNNLKQDALKERQGTEKAKTKWIRYYKFQEKFAEIKYNYAITAHKSQGSTYQNTLIILDDLLKNPRVHERNRILYTSCTRSSDKLYLLN